MNATNATTSGRVIGRIIPAAVRGALNDPNMPGVGEELATHPLVIRAFREAEKLLNDAEARVEAARRQGVQKIAESFSAAVRDLYNQRRKAPAAAAPSPTPSPQRWPA